MISEMTSSWSDESFPAPSGKRQDDWQQAYVLRATESISVNRFKIFGSSLLLVALTSALLINFLNVRGSEFLNASDMNQKDLNYRTLLDAGALYMRYIRNAHQSERLTLAATLHGSWIHVITNCMIQLMFAIFIERYWGSIRTFFVFIVGAVLGNSFSSVMSPCGITVGSSGGCFALVGGYTVFVIEFWHSQFFPKVLIASCFVMTIIALLAGLGGSFDSWAHLFGFLGGLLAALVTLRRVDIFEEDVEAIEKLSDQVDEMTRVWLKRITDVPAESLNEPPLVPLHKRPLIWAEMSVRQELLGWQNHKATWIIRVVSVVILVIMGTMCYVGTYDMDYYIEYPPGPIDMVSPQCRCCWVLWKKKELYEYSKGFECFWESVAMKELGGEQYESWYNFCDNSTMENPKILVDPFGPPPSMLLPYLTEELDYKATPFKPINNLNWLHWLQ